jgi:hypothetical protein
MPKGAFQASAWCVEVAGAVHGGPTGKWLDNSGGRGGGRLLKTPSPQFFDHDQTLAEHRHAVKDYFPIVRF